MGYWIFGPKIFLKPWKFAERGIGLLGHICLSHTLNIVAGTWGGIGFMAKSRQSRRSFAGSGSCTTDGNDSSKKYGLRKLILLITSKEIESLVSY